MKVVSKKTPQMEAFLNELSREMFGRERTGTHCVTCGSEAVEPDDFEDDLSRREFELSHMCQVCQDQTFGRG